MDDDNSGRVRDTIRVPDRAPRSHPTCAAGTRRPLAHAGIASVRRRAPGPASGSQSSITWSTTRACDESPSEGGALPVEVVVLVIAVGTWTVGGEMPLKGEVTLVPRGMAAAVFTPGD